MERVAFEIAGHPIYWYGVMFVLGILAGVWTGSLRARLTTVTPKEFMDSIPWIVVGALIGARALFVITYWDEYFAGQPLWELFAIQRGGLVYFGGLLFSIVTTAFYLVKNKIPVWIFLDILGPSLAVGHARGAWAASLTAAATAARLAPAMDSLTPTGMKPTECASTPCSFMKWG
jgi:phosphatidylglycerol:prolipoprotein diacylglycerol transferase